MSAAQSDQGSGLRSAAGAQRPSRQRRILVFTHGYPPLQMSGAELHIARKVDWWRRRGHEVEVVAADPQPNSVIAPDIVERTFDLMNGLPVHRLRLAAPDSRRPMLETYAHPRLEPIVRERIAAFQPDLVYQISGYILGVLPLQLAALAGLSTVLFANDFWLECQRITLLRPDNSVCPGARSVTDCAACRLSARRAAAVGGERLNRLFWRGAAAVGSIAPTAAEVRLGVDDFRARSAAISAMLAGVDRIVVNSAFLADRLTRLGLARERMLVVRQGIDPSEFVGGERRDLPPAGRLRLLYLGQLSRHKGVDLLIEAVAQLANEGSAISLDLHGPVTDPAVEAMLAGYSHPNVSVGRVLPRRELAGALRAHDALVAPSRWYDNSPNVILEAFATGTPVVAANHGGMAEMVRPEIDGLLFQPGDGGSLAASLRRLAHEPGLLERLKQGIRPPHDLDGEMEPEEHLIDELLDRRSCVAS